MAHKILVVDDEKDVVESVASGLKRREYDVCVAYDGQAALEQVKEFNPDVILLDLTMPKLNGFEVLKEIREKHNDRWRPVIIVSAHAELETFRQCYSMEADHYLTKPCTMEHILKGIETMISLIPLRIK